MKSDIYQKLCEKCDSGKEVCEQNKSPSITVAAGVETEMMTVTQPMVNSHDRFFPKRRILVNEL